MASKPEKIVHHDVPSPHQSPMERHSILVSLNGEHDTARQERRWTCFITHGVDGAKPAPYGPFSPQKLVANLTSILTSIFDGEQAEGVHSASGGRPLATRDGEPDPSFLTGEHNHD